MPEGAYSLDARKLVTALPDGTWYNQFKELMEHTLYDLAWLMISDGVRSHVSTSDMGARIDTSTGRMRTPGQGLCAGMYWQILSTMETLGGPGLLGSTTHITDAALAGDGSGWWEGAWVIITAGTNYGQAPRQVSSFDNLTGKLEWVDPFPAVCDATTRYTVTFLRIEGITNNTTNHVFGRKTTRTRDDKILRWIATTSSTKLEGDIYVASMVVDLSGDISSVEYFPVEHDRHHYPWEVSDIRTSGTLLGIPAGAEVDVFVEHAEVVNMGLFLFELPENVTATARGDPLPTNLAYWITIVNNGAYPADAPYVAIRRVVRRYPLWE